MADDDGRIAPFGVLTDADGIARARWILGSVEGIRTARATLPGAVPAVFTAVAESPDALPFDQPEPLELPTYEGSRQVVHPDYAETPAGAFSSPFHLAITPYPGGNATFENPSLFAGHRRDRYGLEPGAPNPVVLPASGYLSDPDLVYDPDERQFRLYYRRVTIDNIILMVRSTDGLGWTAPIEVARAPNHQIVSPSVVRRARGDWWMWSVNAGAAGCGAATTTVEVRRSLDGVVWSEAGRDRPGRPDRSGRGTSTSHGSPRGMNFGRRTTPRPMAAAPPPRVFIATSPDGAAWATESQPVLIKGRIPEFQDIVYRTSFAYDPTTDAVTFWYSGARYQNGRYVWNAAVERRHRDEVFGRVSKLPDRGLFLAPPVPLTDGP